MTRWECFSCSVRPPCCESEKFSGGRNHRWNICECMAALGLHAVDALLCWSSSCFRMRHSSTGVCAERELLPGLWLHKPPVLQIQQWCLWKSQTLTSLNTLDFPWFHGSVWCLLSAVTKSFLWCSAMILVRNTFAKMEGVLVCWGRTKLRSNTAVGCSRASWSKWGPCVWAGAGRDFSFTP